jgi:anthranilate synthase/aminodeoxychorismate synthase-like glutamine amidotransferase
MNKVVLIDHNDSFTYNLVALIERVSGVKPMVISVDNVVVEEINQYDRIIFSPGAGMPEDYPVSFQILKEYDASKAILGVCLGHQIIAEYYDAKLYNLETVVHGQTKQIAVDNSVLFQQIPKQFKVGLYHSWAVSKDAFPSELQVTSTSEDDIIMSLQHQKHLVFGVQFHPESFLTENGEKIMKNFLKI